MGARTWSNTSASRERISAIAGLRLTVSEERPLIARCYSAACCGLPARLRAFAPSSFPDEVRSAPESSSILRKIKRQVSPIIQQKSAPMRHFLDS